MKTHTLFASIAISVAILSACQSVPPHARNPGPVTEAIKESAQEPTPPPVTSKSVIDGMLPPPIISANEAKFDVNVQNAEAAQFFAGLVTDSPYNIVLRPDVIGTINLSLRNVSVPEVMDIVKDVYGYHYERKGNLFTVFGAGMRTAIIPVNYLNLQRKGMTNTRVASGQVSDAGSSNGGQGGGSSNTTTNTSGSNASTLAATNIETTSDANLWGELQNTLTALVASTEGATVIVNPQSSLVVVKALPNDIHAIREYLSSSETHLQRQVILEAKILEVTLDDGFQAGIDWESLRLTNSGNTLNTTQTGQTPTIPSLDSALNGVFAAAFSSSDFNATIELISTQGTVQVLSSPRVSTVNNQKAIIKVGTDEFFITGISTTTVTGGSSSSTTPNVTLSPFFSGIALDVMPQIDESGEIVLHIHPTVSEVRDQTKTFTYSGEPFTLPLALSSVREADSIVRARSGQIVVIGGLMQNKLKQEDSGVPFLKDIPGLGKLFTQQRESETKSELVILLRPVVTDDEVWKQELQKTNKRMHNALGTSP